MDAQAPRRKDARTDRCMDGQMHGWKHIRTDGWVHGHAEALRRRGIEARKHTDCKDTRRHQGVEE
eukprot:8969865-Alexandrium_andersonii.AAC.1